jgi:D-alanyl-D-alanine dipeptidase
MLNKSEIYIYLSGFMVFLTSLFAPLVVFAGNLEQELTEQGFVNIADVDPTIQVEMKYSTDDNFLGYDIYGDFDSCYLQKEVADKLSTAQTELRKRSPGDSLKVFDCLRPRKYQWKMWNSVDDNGKKYLANPARGSIHNYGCAVDLTIANWAGDDWDMGTKYDHFGYEAKPSMEEKLLKSGELTKQQVENRRVLREVMVKAGFSRATMF